MAKKHKIKLSKKQINEKYPTGANVGEEVARFAGRVAAIMGIFLILALSVDVYHFTH